MNDSDESLTHLVDLLESEIQRLAEVLPTAVDLQWDAPPRPSGVKVKAVRPDPTANVACDSARLNLRSQLERSSYHLREAVVGVRGVRLGLERSLRPYGFSKDSLR